MKLLTCMFVWSNTIINFIMLFGMDVCPLLGYSISPFA